VIIVSQEIAANGAHEIMDGLVKFIKDKNGNILKKEYCGLRSFEKNIKKQKQGHYIWLAFEADPLCLGPLEHRMHYDPYVLRYSKHVMSKDDLVQLPGECALSRRVERERIIPTQRTRIFRRSDVNASRNEEGGSGYGNHQSRGGGGNRYGSAPSMGSSSRPGQAF
jgi:small subunit ribosomal protein S6